MPKSSRISSYTGNEGWSVRSLDGSGVNREVHAPFCERLGVRFPRPTCPLFHVLKNGCRVEALQLGEVKKLELALVIYLVVAWRQAHLVRLARVHPDLPASTVFDQIEWQAAWLLAEKDPPKKTPTVREVIRRIAMLGGFLARKGDGEPGVKTLWQGFARLSSFVRGLEKIRQSYAL
ncbi:hypothetical protein DNK49_22730 [Azoarcus communis]|uniref:Transposase Tn5 dimerisation domain-containing protein n=1 Tax=Parazoarcus communis SWub3 = DSM 12120 TaxID=1121029 RepID=A0A323UQH5_9RHOO|nr:hypothetical protein DNK49_22730 [Azoarcus communis] [Parazoarcus communis SWub3 = DSM 12120]